ncbi:hypothetical protein GCM10022419_135060 [Nonomuraea rosea]|uniref:Aminoglycoside phosphotransferase domain-containing protein n=1 Tax=Nonomuraea rosea TaxID=638574 RepID=A0ABP7A7V8_9ACTN
MTAEITAVARAASFLTSEYNIVPSSVIPAGVGVESEVWRIARHHAPSLCLKWFRGPADRTVVERTVVMDLLARRGLPFPRIHRTRSGDVISTLEGRAVVVVSWIDGSILDELCETSAKAAGAILAKIHDALAEERPSATTSLPSWQTNDVEDMIDRCRRLRARIRRLEERSVLDDKIDRALAERIVILQEADDLRRGLPEIALEPLHFDYTRPNLLFQESSLTGVLDLKGVPGYATWELGRIAFEPKTMVARRDWLDVALAAISAYQAYRRRADIVAVARMTVLYNLFSLWGVANRYEGHNSVIPTNYEDYWLDRHASISTLMASLEEVEAAIANC